MLAPVGTGCLTRLGEGKAAPLRKTPHWQLAPEITKAERNVDWHERPPQIHNRIARSRPSPERSRPSATSDRPAPLRVHATTEKADPGQLLVQLPGLVVAAGSGASRSPNSSPRAVGPRPARTSETVTARLQAKGSQREATCRHQSHKLRTLAIVVLAFAL